MANHCFESCLFCTLSWLRTAKLVKTGWKHFWQNRPFPPNDKGSQRWIKTYNKNKTGVILLTTLRKPCRDQSMFRCLNKANSRRVTPHMSTLVILPSSSSNNMPCWTNCCVRIVESEACTLSSEPDKAVVCSISTPPSALTPPSNRTRLWLVVSQ